MTSHASLASSNKLNLYIFTIASIFLYKTVRFLLFILFLYFKLHWRHCVALLKDWIGKMRICYKRTKNGRKKIKCDVNFKTEHDKGFTLPE